MKKKLKEYSNKLVEETITRVNALNVETNSWDDLMEHAWKYGSVLDYISIKWSLMKKGANEVLSDFNQSIADMHKSWRGTTMEWVIGKDANEYGIFVSEEAAKQRKKDAEKNLKDAVDTIESIRIEQMGRLTEALNSLNGLLGKTNGLKTDSNSGNETNDDSSSGESKGSHGPVTDDEGNIIEIPEQENYNANADTSMFYCSLNIVTSFYIFCPCFSNNIFNSIMCFF